MSLTKAVIPFSFLGRGIAALTLVCLSTAVVAAPLDKEACEALKSKEADYISRGVQANKLKGPDWAKTNLTTEQLDEVKQLIETEEALKFRCPQPKPKPQKTAKRPATNKATNGAVVKPSSATSNRSTTRRRTRRRRTPPRQPTYEFYNPFQ